MGNVIVRYRILPDIPENYQKVLETLEKEIQPDRLDEEPIAFSLKAIKLTKMIPDEPGTEDALENKIRAIEHVETVETMGVTRGL